MREAELWLDADISAIDDFKFDEDVRNAAIGRDKDVNDQAFSLLEKKMKSAGPDILYDIAYGPSSPQLRSASDRAKNSLTKPTVRSFASPALLVTIDLRTTPSCEKKRTFLPRASSVGDARTASLLRSYNVTRGCGFANFRSCPAWPCLVRDGALARTITDIESRTKSP